MSLSVDDAFSLKSVMHSDIYLSVHRYGIRVDGVTEFSTRGGSV